MLLKKQVFIVIGLIFSLGFSWFYLGVFANQNNHYIPVINTDNNIENMDVYLLQVGVFSSLNGVETSKQQLNVFGYQAISYQKDNTYYIIAAVLTDKDYAQEKKVELTNLGFNVYVKQERISAPNIINDINNQDYTLLMEYMSSKE